MNGKTEDMPFPDVSHFDSNELDRQRPPAPEIQGYKIIGELGTGGMGTVWRAEQLSTRRVVALKVMSPASIGSHTAQIRFEREVELSARLQHPNIARVYESGLQKGLYYYAMELVDGCRLDQYVEEHGLNQRQIVKLMQKVCQAVKHAHQLGVIHRDLKPSNIIVTDDGEPHVLDFGLAKRLTQEAGDLTVSIQGEMLGTLPYMSPEQAAGSADMVDVRTDVYSLGVISYKLLTGQYPYDVSGATLEALQNIQKAEPVRPLVICRKIGVEVEAILLKALVKDPDQRYQSAAELERDLEYYLNGLPILAKSVSSLYLLRKVIERHKYTSMVVALLLIIVFGFSCVYFQLNRELRRNIAALQSSNQAISEETGRHVASAQQVAFVRWLHAWQNDDLEQARFIARFFGRGTREAIASAFLMDSRPLDEKISQLRQDLTEQEHCFACFITAEHYLKNEDRKLALVAYQECLTSFDNLEKDEWVVVRARSRLYELEKNSRAEQN